MLRLPRRALRPSNRRRSPLPPSFLARPGRFELPTPGSVDQCSIQLSYGRKIRGSRGGAGGRRHHTRGRRQVNVQLQHPNTPPRRNRWLANDSAPAESASRGDPYGPATHFFAYSASTRDCNVARPPRRPLAPASNNPRGAGIPHVVQLLGRWLVRWHVPCSCPAARGRGLRPSQLDACSTDRLGTSDCLRRRSPSSRRDSFTRFFSSYLSLVLGLPLTSLAWARVGSAPHNT